MHGPAGLGEHRSGAVPQAGEAFLLLPFGFRFAGDAAVQFAVDGSDGVLHGICEASPAAHGLFRGTVQISLPMILSEAAFVIRIGGPIAELTLLQENDQPGAVAFAGDGMDPLAESGFGGKAAPERLLHGVHA